MNKAVFKNNPYLAFLLSFLFPGLGLWYLKLWGKGSLNVGLLFLMGIAFASIEQVPVFIPAFIGIASGAWAYLEADKIRNHPDPPLMRKGRLLQSKRPLNYRFSKDWND